MVFTSRAGFCNPRGSAPRAPPTKLPPTSGPSPYARANATLHQRNTTRRTLATLRGRLLEQPNLDHLAAPPHASNALRPAAAQAHRATLRRRVWHGELVRRRLRDVQRAVHKRRLAVGACGGQGRRGLACVAALFVDDAYAVASARLQACVFERHARVPVGLCICRCTQQEDCRSITTPRHRSASRHSGLRRCSSRPCTREADVKRA
eukprot:COSAG06_NODE_7856_length_2349_cov_1.105637_2_plen_207_part_00